MITTLLFGTFMKPV
jgi:hypothetical protein